MSLANPVKTFRIGIIASVAFDHPHWLDEKLGANLDKIAHLYTNGVNRHVLDWARVNGLPFTCYPPYNGVSVLTSNNQIIASSDKVFILATPESRNGKVVAEECCKRSVQHELAEFEPLAYWKERVCRAQEIIGGADNADIEANPTLKALKAAL